MEQHRFEGSNRKDSITPNELTPLLERLHPTEAPIEIPDDFATVEAVCEATGESEERVWEVLDEIRQQDLEARIAERLREAEEPLYRVERPDTLTNPLENSLSAWARQRSAKTIAERAPKRHRTKTKAKEQSTDTGSKVASTVILVAVVLLFIALAVMAVINATQGLQPLVR